MAQPQKNKIVRPLLETLEPRLMLSGDVVGPMPLSRPIGLAETTAESTASTTPLHLETSIDVENRTGEMKFNWPVVLTLWKVFGSDVDWSRVDPANLHVHHTAGSEVPHMLVDIPPDFSLGNAQIVFNIPLFGAGTKQYFTISHDDTPGLKTDIDLFNSSHNMIPNGDFENFTGGIPDGYSVISNHGVQIVRDTTEKHSGDSSLRLDFDSYETVKLRTSDAIPMEAGQDYHFGIWAKSETMARSGWGFWGEGGEVGLLGAPFNERASLPVNDTRDWFWYTMDEPSLDPWGIPLMHNRATSTVVTNVELEGYQSIREYIPGDGSGTMWIDGAVLMEQPRVTVFRNAPLEDIATDGVVIFTRPADAPRSRAFAHEAADSVDAYAARGERRRIRFGVHALQTKADVEVSVSTLTGPGGATLSGAQLDLETVDEYIGDYAPISLLAGNETAEWMLSVNVPSDATAGLYTGTISIHSDVGLLGELDVSFRVLPMDSNTVPDQYVGGIYNIGYPLVRDTDFYVEYGKAGLNYLMLFDYFSTHIGSMDVDLAGAAQQVDDMVNLAGITSGIGLYREPNMSADQPRMWYQMATGDPTYPGSYGAGTDPQYKDGYQAYATQLHQYALDNNWPDMLYMVSDEPDRPADWNSSMGWLNEALPNALTPVDTMYDDMLRTWDWYNLPVLDNPADWTGPMIYDFVMAEKGMFGICGKENQFASARYQPGLMMATTGSVLWHFWHLETVMAEQNGGVERKHILDAMGAGMNDLRYHATLRDAITRHETGARASVAAEADAWLESLFSFANGDHDRHIHPYNGMPWDWGDIRFYDTWREGMKDYILMLDHAGDSDLDGDVDAVDLADLGLNWNPGGTGLAWQQGDFDGDGDVDSEDLAALGLNWSPAGAAAGGPSLAADEGSGTTSLDSSPAMSVNLTPESTDTLRPTGDSTQTSDVLALAAPVVGPQAPLHSALQTGGDSLTMLSDRSGLSTADSPTVVDPLAVAGLDVWIR